MNKKTKTNPKMFYFFFFIIACLFVVAIEEKFAAIHIREHTEKNYRKVSELAARKITTLIDEKKNATLGIALALAQTGSVQRALAVCDPLGLDLSQFSLLLRRETSFKNVWIQIVDKEGKSFYRSWTDAHGDDLRKIRTDVCRMASNPGATTAISVGKFDIAIKAMAPVYDSGGAFLGFLEIITHFNSIAENLKSEGFETVILVHKKYKNQIRFPFTDKFVGQYYVANKNAPQYLLDHIQATGVDLFFNQSSTYRIDTPIGSLVILYTLLMVL
ncbi:cache domain-containing protein [uncultured Desulfobacter sp.]|uniref:cache domain-containing protein n=1 Tax=uncultured Desulfobacter sp. TaxID=240139 RepID=UPI002AAC0199|nr:cache domain-containing protein [uncultured Desulfobacter sp.]